MYKLLCICKQREKVLFSVSRNNRSPGKVVVVRAVKNFRLLWTSLSLLAHTELGSCTLFVYYSCHGVDIIYDYTSAIISLLIKYNSSL